MADRVIVDQEALENVRDIIIQYFNSSKEIIEDAIKKISLQSEEWNDEDYSRLLSAIKSFLTRSENLAENSKEMLSAIDGKIKQIEILRNKKI